LEGNASGRITAMDGLRGWAALSVVIFHFTWEAFGRSRPEFRELLPSIVGNGRLAVVIFFTLSGYVLTIRRWRRVDNPPYLIGVTRRYVRLTIPILAASLLMLALMSLGLTPTRDAAQIAPGWFNELANFTPSLLGAIDFALVRTYWSTDAPLYHPFLWTMIVELWGSVIVFAISQSPRWLREPYTALLLCCVFFLWVFPFVTCFFLGATLALMQRDGLIFGKPPGRTESMLATLIFAVALVIGGIYNVSPYTLGPTRLDQFGPTAAIGFILVVTAIRSTPITVFLMTPFSQMLGRLSFPLYLMHGLIAATVMPALILWTASFGPLSLLDCWLLGLASILIALAASPLLMPVETFTLDLVKKIRWRPKAAVAVATG
jgi:peptidoglycan/LPS O-acetylase OafA/YrhL